LKFLKAKIDAGADFIVTQLFFDVPLFLNWVRKCRATGIDCPILPGLMPIQSYGGFIKNTVGLSVPSWIRDGIETVKVTATCTHSHSPEEQAKCGHHKTWTLTI